ncbi:hypothetical protein WMY93_007972 [Mugilogobius chulae]|uniref:CWF21 domain-containing protein n=1 Tax=Mugilogobius chulae TaxID=88201 RepID=A0AAW0PJK6_9GOBI
MLAVCCCPCIYLCIQFVDVCELLDSGTALSLSTVTMYDEARVPSPKDGASGVAQAAVPGAGTASGGQASGAVLQAKSEDGNLGVEEEEPPSVEPVLVKKPHREILDHERKRRVELKCMELQEMMEEQGYTEEEIRQKVSTFRQMLMDKEGVITREGTQPPMVNHLHYQHEYEDNPDFVYEDGDYDYGSDNRVKRKSSSSPSPRPKKRKKKKSGRRRSRFGSSSPTRREKKKKSGKKHKRDRSTSGSRKKRRYRSGSPKNKNKDKNKDKNRSPGETPSRSSQRQGSCCSSRSASVSSARSVSKSPSRINSKHKADGQKVSPGPTSPGAWHNGEQSRNGRTRHNHADAEKAQDKHRAPSSGASNPQNSVLREHKLHSTLNRSQAGQAPEGGCLDSRNSVSQTSGRKGDHRGQNKTFHSPTHSSDSTHSQHNHTHKGRTSRHQKRERDSANRSDTDSRARRRSRSYSPIRKRRRDSPSFMEARRITSARKRPIPYYRPSPSSSSSSGSSPSSRSRSRSYSSRSRSRSWSRSRSRTHHSYYSHSSDDSPGF